MKFSHKKIQRKNNNSSCQLFCQLVLVAQFIANQITFIDFMKESKFSLSVRPKGVKLKQNVQYFHLILKFFRSWNFQGVYSLYSIGDFSDFDILIPEIGD